MFIELEMVRIITGTLLSITTLFERSVGYLIMIMVILYDKEICSS